MEARLSLSSEVTGRNFFYLLMPLVSGASIWSCPGFIACVRLYADM